jgi:hypothetical protein
MSTQLGFDQVQDYPDSLVPPRPPEMEANDIDKQCYLASLPIVTEKLRPGGVLLAYKK